MAIVMGLDQHRAQITAEWINIDTGELHPTCTSNNGYRRKQVLPAADVVVAHGGSGTTFGALAAGVPLVLVPFFADQPVNSDRVATRGAAIVVAAAADPRPTRAVTRLDPLRLRAAIESLLGDTSRRAASRIAAEMRALSCRRGHRRPGIRPAAHLATRRSPRATPRLLVAH